MLLEENLFGIHDKVETAIGRLRAFEPPEGYFVAFSGGKDSLALLCALCDLRRFYPKKFSVVAITVNAGFPGMDFTFDLTEYFTKHKEWKELYKDKKYIKLI